MAERYGVAQRLNFAHNANLAPTQETPIIGKDAEGQRKLRLARFGLVPGWAKDAKPSYAMINAKAETIAEKPAYKGAFEKRRCIVPVQGFYEWRKEEGRKQPYCFSDPAGKLLSLAGIWEFNNQTGEEIYSFAIITTAANDSMAAYHHRMPAIVADDELESWLDGGQVDAVLQPTDIEFAIERMDPAMNNPRAAVLDG
jgi:putative SOS response-associated peptidase YedK